MRRPRHDVSRRVLGLTSGLILVLGVAPGAGGPATGAGPFDDSPWGPYVVESFLTCGAYTACVWASQDPAAPSCDRVVTIERNGELVEWVDWASGLHALSGTDIDGSGWPNLIIERYSGGAHCCFSVCVYDLAENLVAVELPPSPGGNASGEFVDLDRDGVFEFATADDSFAYDFCAFAGTPFVRVILAYDDSERRYAPASFRFPELYAADIERDRERAQVSVSGGGEPGWDGTPKCEVLPLVLDYLYSGDSDSAWQALDAYYPFADKDAFRDEIERVVLASRYFVVKE